MGPLAIPANPVSGFPTPVFNYGYTFSIVTQDAVGNVLPNCGIKLYRTVDDSVAAQGVSDGSGNYSVGASNALNHYFVIYKAGSPDVFGTTLNTLVPV